MLLTKSDKNGVYIIVELSFYIPTNGHDSDSGFSSKPNLFLIS